jgi:tetratricopeptide (TPR) repeat protein
LKISPEFAVAYYNRGLAWGAQDRPDRAFEDFTRALELNSAFFKTHRRLSELLRNGAMNRVCRVIENR